MATLNLKGTTTVKELKEQFHNSFGSQLRMYDGNKVADDGDNLSTIGLKADGDFECRSSLSVASFIACMQSEFGLKVKVYTCDNWVAVLDSLTLESSGKVKKSAVRADMESMVAYHKAENSANLNMAMEALSMKRKDRQVQNPNADIMCTLNGKENILAIMKSMVENELNKEATSMQEATYNDQKLLISNLFKSTKEYNRGTIMLRLVVIDSLYSTNAAYSYFSFEEMAERIFKLGNEEDAREYFSAIAHGQEDKEKLFSEAYGYQKNLSEGSKQMSLLSKYAYYTLFSNKQDYPIGFPIYDSLAKKTYPTICKMLQLKKIESIGDSIENYVAALAAVRMALFGEKETLTNGLQQFDMLDAYLWRMGKIDGGNFSLLLGREDYDQFINNLELQAEQDEDDAAYKKRMKSLYGDTFDFNDKVAELCLDPGTNPFKKIESKNYLDQLTAHWRLFVAASKAK